MNERELKFRIWVHIDKAFHYFDIEDYPSGIAMGVSHPMQFTGLKDMNGVDIYEGDIVKNDASDWFGVIEISSFSGVQVADKNGKLPIGLYDSKEGVDMDLIYTSYRLVGTKVIGNIMEHKHLLE